MVVMTGISTGTRLADVEHEPTADPTGDASDGESDRGGDGTVADAMEPMLTALMGGPPPVLIEFWDGSSLGSTDGPGTLRINSADALRRIVWAPNDLGFGRAFVCGDIDAIGPVAELLRALQQAFRPDIRIGLREAPAVFSSARAVGALGRPLDPPPEEVLPRGLRHSIFRDRQAVGHHYGVGNEFYEIVLGPSMTYSCARFVTPSTSLEDAQAAKHDLIARKLGLADDSFRHACAGDRPRLLDVGCGWGSMAIHAATRYDVEVVGVTLSHEQASYARERVAGQGLTDRVEIRVQDYREITDGPFDAISSIGMAEHVGHKKMVDYFAALGALLRAGGRILNHAIASIGGSRLSRKSFIGRYVFPDGELLDLSTTIVSMEKAGFEVRDVENLREHYAATLRCWVANLEADWDQAVELVGERRARVWLLYMSGSINGFDDAGLELHQTLGVKSDNRPSDLPSTRVGWG
jgi:cyclopropane-fatty-acyl-phospholipid synthase